MIVMKRCFAIVLALAMLMGMVSKGAAAGGTQAAKPAPVAKTSLVFALNQEPAAIDPYMVSTPQGLTVSTLIHESLIKKDDSGKYVPWLAKSWEQTDPTTFVFHLRNDVTFHDGSKFTAADAAYSLGVAATSSFTAPLFGSIDPANTKALDDYTVQIKLKAPYAPLFEALASFRGAMLCKAYREKVGKDVYGHAPVGTGPMKFKQWVSGDRIEMEAYAGYWGSPMPFKTATARFIVEGSARAIDLETGGIDIATDLAFSDWDRIAKNPNTALISGESQSHSFLLLNNIIPPTTNQKVRLALAHALDMANLVKTAYQGQASVADSFYTPNILGYKKVGPYTYDPALAKQLLTEAGFPNGFSIDFYTMENQLNMATAEIIQSMWGKVGVTVNIKIVDLATITELNNSGKCTGAVMAPTVSMADPDAGLTIWPIYRPISIRHNDQHIQDLLDAGRSTYDTAKRVQIYQELQDYLFEKCYSIPVAFPKAAFGTRSNITGLKFAPSLVPDLTTVRFK